MPARAVGLLIKESRDVEKKRKGEGKRRWDEKDERKCEQESATRGVESRFRLDQQVKGERRESK